MLIELSVRDFALIDTLSLNFARGFNVITGETGAGKSILLGALGSLLGMRTGADMIRTGAERATVEASINLPAGHPALSIVDELGADTDADGNGRHTLILRREMRADGRTRAWIGGVSVPVRSLRELGDLMVDFHGQHDHQYLLNPSGHGAMLDSFAGNAPQRAKVSESHAGLTAIRAERRALVKRQQELVTKRDMMEFERKEIEDISPQPGEQETLESELRVLENVEKLGGLLDGLSQLLSESDESVVTQLGTGRRWITDAAEIDSALDETTADYEELEVLVQDVAGRIADRLASLDADPMRLEEVQNRLVLLRRLTRRYGTIEETLERYEELQGAMDEEAGFEDRIADLDDDIRRKHQVFADSVVALSVTRKKAAEVLGTQVTESLRSLGMERAHLAAELNLTPADAVDPTLSDAVEIDGEVVAAGPEGAEQIELMISPNLGEPLKQLARIASGGEISRVMLAMKSVLASHDPVEIMIFDEIDQGVSGLIAEVVAARMRDLASERQVIAITHLPQISSYADRHIIVAKNESAGRTTTEAYALTGEDRVRATAELLGGAITDTALEHARDMLSHARTVQGDDDVA
jgi:DNA repair protein RecN (Recombination protein N)